MALKWCSKAKRWAECQKRAVAIARDHALILVPPYDDPAIIAGQGTVALEMFEEIGDLAACRT
jgi:threonine dehydratase